MTFAEFQQWAFLAVASSGVLILREMNKNIASLNEKVAVLMVGHETTEKKFADQGKKFDDHESRLRKLENN